ncbi:MAG: hypothetical protein IT442_04310 [Phycisphaeraceae bacterium]|nr:hypothetical protein [Phycisphaeraceae bacterium]
MSHSSTSSFRSFDLRGLRPGGALFCLALLTVVEVGFARQEWLWSKFPKSPSGIIDVLEDKVIKPAGDPVVIVLGNSRTRDAVIPIVMEQELGLERGEVLNLSVTAGEPFDSFVLYERNRDTMRKANLVVLAVEEWQLNDDRAISERYRRFASLQDRLSYPDRQLKSSLVAGWLWRTFDARKPLGRLAKEMVLSADRSAPIGDDGRVVWRTDDPELGEPEIELKADLERAYGGFVAGRMKQTTGYEYLRRVIKMASEDNVAVALVSPPHRDAFIDLLPDVRGAVADVAFQDVLTDLAAQGDNIEVSVITRASELDMPDTYFVDYGHMVKRGAEVYTEYLSRWLRENYDEALP